MTNRERDRERNRSKILKQAKPTQVIKFIITLIDYLIEVVLLNRGVQLVYTHEANGRWHSLTVNNNVITRQCGARVTNFVAVYRHNLLALSMLL